MTYRARPEALTDALSGKQITSAASLSRAAGIAQGTAQAVLRGEVVTLATVTKVRRALGVQPSQIFEWVRTAGADQ